MSDIFTGKDILVTGGAGTIGSAIVRNVLKSNPRVVRVLDNNETAVFNLEQELQSERFRPLIGDIRDKDRLKRAVLNVQVVFHAAALKHVPLSEYNPFEAVKTNVLGTQNLIEVAMDEEVEKMITISTDKAVNPVNVMGATKLLAERLTLSAEQYKGWGKTLFSCVRFGNVLDSRGSVVPVFREQIINGGPVTITDPKMTRFVMNISKAAELVLTAAEMSKGGEIFIFKMSALSIGTLTEAMIEEIAPKYGYSPEKIKVKIIGKRAGEKDYEELITEDEAANVYETDNMFILSPRESGQRGSKETPADRYISSNQELLTKDAVKELIRSNFQ